MYIYIYIYTYVHTGYRLQQHHVRGLPGPPEAHAAASTGLRLCYVVLCYHVLVVL